jgi:hypothetical protein
MFARAGALQIVLDPLKNEIQFIDSSTGKSIALDPKTGTITGANVLQSASAVLTVQDNAGVPSKIITIDAGNQRLTGADEIRPFTATLVTVGNKAGAKTIELDPDQQRLGNVDLIEVNGAKLTVQKTGVADPFELEAATHKIYNVDEIGKAGGGKLV